MSWKISSGLQKRDLENLMLNSNILYFLPSLLYSFLAVSSLSFQKKTFCHTFFFSSENWPFSARPTNHIFTIQDDSCSPYYWICIVWSRKHFVRTICKDLFRLYPFEATILYVRQSVLITAASIEQWRPNVKFGDKMLKKVLECPWLSYHKIEK